MESVDRGNKETPTGGRLIVGGLPCPKTVKTSLDIGVVNFVTNAVSSVSFINDRIVS